MNDIASYRHALIEVKNLIDAYKKNKLTVIIFSLLLLAFIMALSTLMLIRFALTKHSSLLGPAEIAMIALAVMMLSLMVGYWLIFQNPSLKNKRQALFEKLVASLSQVSPHSELYRVLIVDYKNQIIGEHALLNMVLAELRRTETLST